MSNLKISQLPAATTLTGAESIELVQAGGNVRATVDTLVDQAVVTADPVVAAEYLTSLYFGAL